MSDATMSVVIATYNRTTELLRLLEQLERQTVGASAFEVIVVDDGSSDDVRGALGNLRTAFSLTVIRQRNAGAASARQRGAALARCPVLVFVDDDMSIGPDFLASHARYHAPSPDSSTVVLGRIRLEAMRLGRSASLSARFHARTLARRAEAFARGIEQPRGHSVYTGNVSMSRPLFFRAGGFDTSFRAIEDEELGIRLEGAGARFVFAPEAVAIDQSSGPPDDAWAARAFRDGVYTMRVARKHPRHALASPWRYLSQISLLSKPLLALSVATPGAARHISRLGVYLAHAVDEIGVERVAIAAMTVGYGMNFYRGVQAECGGLAATVRDYASFVAGRRGGV